MVQNMKGKENFCKDNCYFNISNSGYSENKYPCYGQVCEEERKTVGQISLITPAVAASLMIDIGTMGKNMKR